MGKLKDLREVLKGLKHKKLTKPAPKLCPRCGSPKIRLSSSFDTYPRMYGITPGRYICEDCGYKGPIAIELEEEEKP
jgi:C4-type Zn-finger protein